MNTRPKIIVITGAESTGKSTLTNQLAEHYKVPYVSEIARDYVENLSRSYTYSDVEEIAKLQIEKYNELSKMDAPFIFIDTWLIVTKIWLEFVYKKIPDWLIDAIQNLKIDLFLLCEIDIPWIEDPVRENGGKNREILHKKYIENLNFYNFKFEIVKGLEEQRFLNAIRFLNDLK